MSYKIIMEDKMRENFCSVGNIECGRYHAAKNLSTITGGCELFSVHRGFITDMERCPWPSKQINLSGPCPICGQVDHGQTGEHPCHKCGLPRIHDER
jgi:hypothetical protein